MSDTIATDRRATLALRQLFGARRLLCQLRRRRRLSRARAKVASALAEGRLSPAVGEALTVHLEKLRQDCSSGREI